MIKRSHRTTVRAFAITDVLALAGAATAYSSGSDKPVAAATPSSASPTAAATTSAAATTTRAVHWEGGGQQGDLPAIKKTANTALTVGEVQVLN